MTNAERKPVREGELLWQPSPERIEQAEITCFMAWLHSNHGLRFDHYEALRQWSVADIEAFWAALSDFYEIDYSQPYDSVLTRREMPGAEWFPGARLNFAEHALRHLKEDEPALWHASESQRLKALSGSELRRQVACIAQTLREQGIGPGDRVVAFMPNIPETMIACLAVTSIGAIWSACSTEFGAATVLDRFTQIEPKLLISVDGYRHGGKDYDRSDEVARIVEALPTLKQLIWLPYLDEQAKAPRSDALIWSDLLEGDPAPLQFEQIAFDHPLWIVYSSGTTGLPKAIVHGHGGVLLELHKMLGLHSDLKPGDRMFFYSSSGWIMWNILMSSLLVGAQPVLYDGHPAPDSEPDVLWRLAAESKATLFGGSPAYLQLMQNAGVVPRDKYDMSAMQGVLLSGSPVTPESMQWLYQNVKQDLWVTSQSGGTDVASAFVNGSCILPVYAGEIQARSLAVDAEAWNDQGNPVVGEVGELVIKQPLPSMPLYFWNDSGNERYQSSYFEPWPGVWRHGDFFELNARGGCFIRGRSDSTLNRHGVRIGTAEIYRCVEALDEVEDALVVNVDLPDGGFFMPLFVKMESGKSLEEGVINKIKQTLKEQCSPRHVPDEILQVPLIPYTLTGKKLEVPVRRILMGADIDKAVSRDAMQNPSAIDFFIRYAADH